MMHNEICAVKMIIEGEIASRPSNRDSIFQSINGLIDMEILFQFIENNLTEEIYMGVAKALLSKNKNLIICPSDGTKMDGDENG